MRHKRYDPARRGVEEARIVIVRWFDKDGVVWNSVRTTGPDDGTVGIDLVTEMGMLATALLTEWERAGADDKPSTTEEPGP